MSYVKIALKCWTRELYAHLTGLFDPEMFSMEELEGEEYNIAPAFDLMDEFVVWAKNYFNTKDAPTAKDLANHYFNDAEFICREEEPCEGTSWYDYCKSKGCLFWNMNYGCLAIGDLGKE